MKKIVTCLLVFVLLLSTFFTINVFAQTDTEINYDKLDYRLFNKIDSMEDEQFYVHWDIDDSNYSVVYNVQQIFTGETDKFFYIDEESSYAETWMTKAQIAEVSSYKNTRAVYYLWSTKLDDDIIKRKTSSDLENVLKTMTDTETLRVNVVTNSNNVSPAYSKDIIIKTVPRLENSNIVEGTLNLYKQEILDLISCDYVRYLYYNVDDVYESKVERWGSFQLNQTCENVTSDCTSSIITPAGNREITFTPNDGYAIDEYTVTIGGRDWTAQSTSFKDNKVVVSLYYTYADVDINVKAVPYSETDVTETTGPTETTEPTTEVTETTEPTAETTEPTGTEENVTFTVDEGVCARYERVAFYDDYLYIIYTYNSTDYLYNAGEISVKVNGEEIDTLKANMISINPIIRTYQFYAKADDKVDMHVSKGSIAEDYRFEFIFDEYLKSNEYMCNYSVRVNKINVAYCNVSFYLDSEHGVDTHFYVDDVEITDVQAIQYKAVNGENCFTYDFSVGGSDKVVVKATSYVVEPTETTEPTESTEPTTEATKPTEPVTTPTEGTEPTEPVEKKANPVKVTVKNTSVSAKKLVSKKQTVKPITVKDAKGAVEVVKVKSGTATKIYKKITVNKKTGAITFNKGKYSKKTYSIKLKITAKGNSEYKSKVITKTVKVKVK